MCNTHKLNFNFNYLMIAEKNMIVHKSSSYYQETVNHCYM